MQKMEFPRRELVKNRIFRPSQDIKKRIQEFQSSVSDKQGVPPSIAF
jgi:hypothetical protein